MSLMRRRALEGRRQALFLDTFDADSSALYTVINPKAYTIAGGKLSFSAGLDTQTVWMPDGFSFADGKIGCILDQANDAGLAFRIVNSSNYYVAIICDNLGSDVPSRQVAGIWRQTAGSWTQLGAYISLPGGFTRGDTHQFEVTMSGSAFGLWYDGALLGTRTDATHASGRVGARANRSPVRFDSFYIEG